MPLNTFKLPHIPHIVPVNEIHSNGSLLTDEEIKAVKLKLSTLPDGLYRKKKFADVITETRYGVIKCDGQYFVIFRDNDKEKNISSHEFEPDPKVKPRNILILSKTKVIQNLDTREFGLLKVIIDHSQTDAQAAIKAKEVEQEFQNLRKLGKVLGSTLTREPEPDLKKLHKKYYLLMKLEPGFNLKLYNALTEKVTENGINVEKYINVPAIRWVEIAIKILEKVEELHKNGMLHCDLKPENFVYDQTSNEINIVDWSTAIPMDANGNGFQSPLRGTDVHIPPEHFDRYNSLRREFGSENRAANGVYFYNEATEMHSVGVTLQMLFNIPVFEKGSPGESVANPRLYQEGADKVFTQMPEVWKFLHAMTAPLVKTIVYEKNEAKENGIEAEDAHENGIHSNVMSTNQIKATIKNKIKEIHLTNPRPTFAEAIDFFKELHKKIALTTHLKVAIIDLNEFDRYFSKKHTDREDRFKRYRALLKGVNEVCIISKIDFTKDEDNQKKYYIMMLKIQNMIMQKRLICMPNIYITTDIKDITQLPSEIDGKKQFGSYITRSYIYLDGSTYDIENSVLTEAEKTSVLEKQKVNEVILKSHNIHVIKIANYKTKKIYLPEMRAFNTLLEKNDYLSLISELKKQSDVLDYQYKLTVQAQPRASFMDQVAANLEMHIKPQNIEQARYRYEQINVALTRINVLYAKGTLSIADARNILSSLKTDIKFTGPQPTNSLMRFFEYRPAPVAKIADLATTLERKR